MFLVENAAAPPNENRPQPREDNASLLFLPERLWCPWNNGSCSDTLKVSGQGTIEISQKVSKSVELRISTSENPSDHTAHSITLSITTEKVEISASDGGSWTCTDPLYTLQEEDGYWHKYWISLFSDDRRIRYGVGEIRPKFAILDILLPEVKSTSMKQLKYLYIRIDNNDQMLSQLQNLSDKFRLFIGTHPVRNEFPLFVIPTDVYTFEQNAIGLPPTKLDPVCQELYAGVINFKLNTDDFPKFTESIARSIKDTRGWCYRKLASKAAAFGGNNREGTYLRLTAGEQEGNAPGHTNVIEVWPPGHFSPIHNHANTHAIIRVLSGEVLVRVFPELRSNTHQFTPIEQICKTGCVTWMSPDRNQTHQLKHVDPSGEPGITIQCYMYGVEDRLHYETFDYIKNDKSGLGRFFPKSDMDYYQFKDMMKDEERGVFVPLI